MAQRALNGRYAAALCAVSLLATSGAGAVETAPRAPNLPLRHEAPREERAPPEVTFRPRVTIDPSCKGFAFDRKRLEEDVFLELDGQKLQAIELEVRCAQDLHAHVSERLGDALLEQTVELSSLPPSAWHRVLVLSFVEGAAALRARAANASVDEREAAATAVDASTRNAVSPTGRTSGTSPEQVALSKSAGSSEPSAFDPAEPRPAGEGPIFPKINAWVLGGGATRLTEHGVLIGGQIGVRYRPIYVGLSVLSGETSRGTMGTVCLAWFLTTPNGDRWSPLVAPRVSVGILSRPGSAGSDNYYTSYFDAGLWLGGTVRLAEEWAVSAALDAGYGLPTTVGAAGDTAQAGGAFVGAVVMLGSHP